MSQQDLLLKAAALEFILRTDEVVFLALAPEAGRRFIDRLAVHLVELLSCFGVSCSPAHIKDSMHVNKLKTGEAFSLSWRFF